VSLGPDRAPVSYLVVSWWEIADALDATGDGALAAAIRTAMEGRLGDRAAFALTEDERARVAAAVLEGDG